MTAAGSVDDYDAAKKADLECRMADVAGVECDAVTLTVTAGSVVLDFVIVADSSVDIADLQAKVTTALSTKDLATTALGVEIESVPEVSQVLARLCPDPSSPCCPDPLLTLSP